MIGSALHTVIRIGRLLSTTCTLGWPSDFYPLSRQDFCFGWYWILSSNRGFGIDQIDCGRQDCIGGRARVWDSK